MELSSCVEKNDRNGQKHSFVSENPVTVFKTGRRRWLLLRRCKGVVTDLTTMHVLFAYLVYKTHHTQQKHNISKRFFRQMAQHRVEDASSGTQENESTTVQHWPLNNQHIKSSFHKLYTPQVFIISKQLTWKSHISFWQGLYLPKPHPIFLIWKSELLPGTKLCSY